jgi:hypothetical protein
LAKARGEQLVYLGGVQFENCWKALAQDRCKGSWDAAFVSDSGRMGRGVVVGDSFGNLLAARCETQLGCLAPTVAKVKAV